jgi:hypothetical protein
MSQLTTADQEAIRAVLSRCADETLSTVSAATAGMTGTKAAEFRMILKEEVLDRRRQALVFGPLAPMFRPRRDEVAAMTFPAQVLPQLWRLARAREPRLLDRLENDDLQCGDVANRICQAAASAVRDQPHRVWSPELEPELREAGLRDLAACLDLAHLARRALPSLQSWLKQPDDDQLAELRLLIHDCGTVHVDGARRLLEILFAHLDDAVLVLRLVTRISGSAKQETFLSASEFADFVNRLLAGVQTRAERVAAWAPSVEAEELSAVLRDLEWCAEVLDEMDVTLDLDPRSEWGRSAREARLVLSDRLSRLISSAEGAVDRALPLVRVKIAGRMTRMAPLVGAPLAGPAMDEALAVLQVMGAVRNVAGTFGCEAGRRTAVEALSLRLTDYADDLLSMIRDQEAPDEEHALGQVGAAARFLEALGAQSPARTVRRRAAAAGGSTPQPGASSRAA